MVIVTNMPAVSYMKYNVMDKEVTRTDEVVKVTIK